jgi:glycosyltransferase involved in cell wall biosynthesis
MRVGYDEQVFLAQRHGGISRYVVSLVEAMRDNPGLGIDAVAGWHWSDNQHSNAAGLSRMLPIPAFSERLALVGQGAYYLANTAARRTSRQASVLHHTYFHPKFWAPRFRGHHVCTVYDMIPELYPESFPTRDPHLAKRRYVERCDVIFCISESARRDLVEIYGDPGVPLPVTPLGVGAEFRPGLAPLPSLPARYLLFVGRRGGYKDFDVLLRAFSALEDRDTQLAVVGGGPFTDAEQDMVLALGIGHRVHRIDVADADLPRAYGNALAFVFPSRHEGFGLPTLEAMASGTAVVLADSSAHPEVGGTVARYFPPGDDAVLRENLEELSGDQDLRVRLGVAGVARAAQFTWQATARATAAGYPRD